MMLAVNLDQYFHNDVLQIGLRDYFCICIITHNAVSVFSSSLHTCFCSWLSCEDMDSSRILVCWSSSCAAPTRWLLLSAD